MTQQEAVQYLQARRNTKISAIYQDDDTLVDALYSLVPDFEYPAHDTMKCGEFVKRYAKRA